MVISVIGILSGLLLPALNAARNRAHTISCVGSMKQIGQAYFNYVSDWNMTPPVSKSGIRWIDCLEPYFVEKSERSSGNVFVCPADRRPEDKKVVYGTSDVNKLSYGINQCYPSNRESATPILWNGIGATLIRNPAGFITLADAGSYYIGTTVAVPFFGTLNGGSLCRRRLLQISGVPAWPKAGIQCGVCRRTRRDFEIRRNAGSLLGLQEYRVWFLSLSFFF
ncbi:MAG: hypothetical protein L6W00_20960 [Lentisphaeria bacterium]|nr:MAG: hypothetical protein L6W00_20960 [Lentisphaeria bacterium]